VTETEQGNTRALAATVKGTGLFVGFPITLALLCTTQYAHEIAQCQLATCFINWAGLLSLAGASAALVVIGFRWLPAWFGHRLPLLLVLAICNFFTGSLLLENGTAEHGWWRRSLAERLAFVEHNIIYSLAASIVVLIAAAILRRQRGRDLYAYVVLVCWGYLIAGLSRMASLCP